MRLMAAGSIVALLVGAPALQAQSTYEASIARTQHNIPHITAEDWGGIGYGVAYAYAQDNFCMMAEEFTTIAGERSRHFGPEETAILGFTRVDNLTSDVFFRGQIDLPSLRAGWANQSQASRDVVDGYVAGWNRYLSDTGPDALPEECRNKPWVRRITRDDMLRLNEKQMLLASSLALAPGIATAAPPGSPSPAQTAFAELPKEHEDLNFGSNGWAFGGDATGTGGGMLIGNPHFPWEGPSRFWQLHVTIPGEYDAMGVGIAGTPIVTLGFNKDIAWTHTVTAARHFTVYALTLSPDDPTIYMVDGQPVEMEAKTVSVPMPDGAEPVERTLYSTQFGAVLTIPGTPFGWSETSAFTIQDANSGNQRAIATWMAIGKASNVGEIEAAISSTLGIPWVNTIAADRNGDALHADITAVPGVSAEFVAECATPFSGLVADRLTLLNGTRSDCNWRDDAADPASGLLPASDQAVRVRRDYVTNSNDSYWISNPSTPYEQLSPILGDFERALTLRTRSNFIETETVLESGNFDRDAAKALVFGNRSLAADMVVEPLLTQCQSREELSEACGALAAWDRKFEADSQGAYLFVRFWNKVRGNQDLWNVPFDASDFINTPRDLDISGSKGDAMLDALAEAAAELREAGIALDAPWGEVQVRIASGDSIAIHGGPGTAGVLNMQRSREIDAAITPIHGSSYIQIVSFNEAGPIAEAILSYSQSTNPASEHYSDQTRLYAAKDWHRLPFAPDEIAAGQIGETITIAE